MSFCTVSWFALPLAGLIPLLGNKLVVSVLCPQYFGLLTPAFPKASEIEGLTGRSQEIGKAHSANSSWPLSPCLPPFQGASAPFSHAQDKNEAAAIFIEGPKLKIGLKHNLKK